jgi:hypothetical protein
VSILNLCLFCIFPGARDTAEFIIYIPSMAPVTIAGIIVRVGGRN